MSQSTHPEPLPSPQGGTPWLWLLLVVLVAAAGGADGRSGAQGIVLCMSDAKGIRRWRTLAAIAALAGVVLLKLPVLSLPLFGDELAYYFGAVWIQEHGFFALPWWTEPYVFLSHPPGQFWLSAAVFELLGDRTWPIHAVMLGLALVTLLYTYRIAAHLTDRWAGVTAALLLFSMPLFFAQSVLMMNDLPVAAFGSLAVYYTLAGRRWKYVAAATLAGLFKITAGAIIVPCALYLAWQHSGGGEIGGCAAQRAGWPSVCCP